MPDPGEAPGPGSGAGRKRFPGAGLLPAGALAGVLLVYLALPATVYRGDGMAYAQAIERGSPAVLNPNHLLYGALGYGLLHLTRAAGLDLDAIVLLRYLGVAAAAACLILFPTLLRKLGVDRRSSLAFTLCLAFTSGFWLQAISPETFGLSMALALAAFLATAAYLGAPSAGRAMLVGAACGLAVAGTVVDLLLVPGVAFVVGRASPRRSAVHLAVAGLALAAVILTAFGAAAAAAGVPPEDLSTWLLGRASRTEWVGFQAMNLLRSARNLVGNLVPQPWILMDLAAGDLSPWNLLFAALAMTAFGLAAILAVNAVRAYGGSAPADRRMLICLGCYFVSLTAFFTVWVNHSTEFWATHWVPLWAMLAVALKRDRRRWARRIAPSLAAVLGLAGLLFLALPQRFSPERRLVDCLERWITAGDAVVVTWFEDLRRPVGRLLRRDPDPLRRSTFAVNLETYLPAPLVHHVGCWETPGRTRCFQSGSAERLVRDLRESHRAWLLRVSEERPEVGEAAGILDVLGSAFRTSEAARCGDAAFSTTSLHRLQPVR